MVGSQKILTVSYGTFSCTLEGFEDSFGTMKAIAEYFRDLAADDRYFGAEPATPDAEMLARIAEREVARRVDARMERSGIVLRVDNTVTGTLGRDVEAASPDAASAQLQAPAEMILPTAAAEPALSAPVPSPVAMAASVEAEAVPAPRMPPAPPARAAQDDVAAKLARIRAVVGRAAVASSLQEEEAAQDDVVSAEPVPPLTAPAHDAVAATPDHLAARAEEPENVAAVEEPAAPIAVEAAPGPIEIAPAAAALSRPRVIRMRRTELAAIGAVPLAAVEVEVEPEPEPAALPPAGALALSPEAEADLQSELAALEAERLASATAQADPAALEEPAAPVSDKEPTDDLGIEATVAGLIAADEPAEGRDAPLPPKAFVAEVPTPVAVPAQEPEIAAALAALAVIEEPEAPTEPEPEAPLWAEVAPTEPSAEAEPAEVASTSAPVAFQAWESDDLVAPHDEAQAPSAWIEAEPAVEAIEEPVAAVAPSGDAEWSPAEVREDEAAAPIAAAPEADLNESPAAPMAEALRPRSLAEGPDGDEAAVSRLLSRTDAQLADPEGSRRREAIAQLRAAVAATEAARLLGDTQPSAEQRQDPFRDDLRQAVRPRRPVAASEARAEPRPERPRPAPLKLVPSLRVDLPAAGMEAGTIQPVRPRRVSVEASVPTPMPDREPEIRADHALATPMRGEASFAAFAAEMGAVSLTDILEAAAAYTSFVEGAEDFSRPQIIDRVRHATAKAFSREDGLRSFGTLLRQGTITRVRGGRFQVAGESRFNPQRRAG